ncbi:MAG TPA: aconitase X catalytic domain-containing protein [Acidimicrobiia bacterium]|nr:aconitase X catalytic domain-containing protein [Acidimicrobiia bacterium]
MLLTEEDRARLNGEAGEATRIAMELVVAAGEAVGAGSLLDITGAHVDSCLYHGLASLDFAERLSGAGGAVTVPTTLNVTSLDLLHPELYRGDEVIAARARKLIDAYVAMGCRPTWTCAPYQLVDRPRLGDQVAWGESNAIVYANSVLGARTNRYGDFLDICCALTGRVPYVGLHTDEGRRATVRVDVEVPDSWLDDDLLYVAVGHALGKSVGTEVAVITGLDDRADEDRLKALGAVAASSGAVGMFHVEGVTPEAATRGDACQGRPVERVVTLDPGTVRAVVTGLSSTTKGLGAVSVGTPHASLAELESLASLCSGRRTMVPFYVSTARDILAAAGAAAQDIEAFGATIVTDTCTYLSPILEPPDGAVMTNSGKWAYYAPANLGVEVVLASLSDCVESAVGGETVLESWA